MNPIVEAGRILREAAGFDPRLEERRNSAYQLRLKFDQVLDGRKAVYCRVIAPSLLDKLPITADASGAEILLVKDLTEGGEYFCEIMGVNAGVGFELTGVECRAFPIVAHPVAKKIDLGIGTEGGDRLSMDLQRLSFGHRLADVLVDINKQNPGIFQEGFGDLN